MEKSHLGAWLGRWSSNGKTIDEMRAEMGLPPVASEWVVWSKEHEEEPKRESEEIKGYDFTVLRYRYDDDPVVLALLDELEAQQPEVLMLRRTVDYERANRLTAEKRLNDVAAAKDRLWAEKADYEIKLNEYRAMLNTEREERAGREARWKLLLEDLAKATGHWTEPVREQIRELTEPARSMESFTAYEEATAEVLRQQKMTDMQREGWKFAGKMAAVQAKMKTKGGRR